VVITDVVPGSCTVVVVMSPGRVMVESTVLAGSCVVNVVVLPGRVKVVVVI
jgi:hypothetical protein